MNASVVVENSNHGVRRWHLVVPMRYSLSKTKFLGMGSFGPVCKALDRKRKKHVAIECITCDIQDAHRQAGILRYIKILRLLSSHPNVLKMINISEDPAREELYVVTRLGCGRINDPIFLKQSEDGELIKSVTQQLLEVARAMHHIGIVHFAINPSTVALFQGCHVRIKGFQSSAEIGAPREERAGDMMDRWHRAPEALLSSSSPYAASMDVYSVGCILAEMLLQRQLFGGVSYGEHIAAMFRLQGYNGVQDLGFEPDTYAASILQERCISPPRMLATTFPTFGLELCDLLSKLLTVNPTKRITAEKALRHPFFSTAPLRFPASKQVQLTPPPADFFTFDAGTALRGVQLQQLISEEVRTCATELGQDVFDPLYLPLTCR